jgi:hypothetical protein
MDLLQCQPIIILAPVIEHTAVLNTNTSKADKVAFCLCKGGYENVNQAPFALSEEMLDESWADNVDSSDVFCSVF